VSSGIRKKLKRTYTDSRIFTGSLVVD
jgi:hypothetical protein